MNSEHRRRMGGQVASANICYKSYLSLRSSICVSMQTRSSANDVPSPLEPCPRRAQLSNLTNLKELVCVASVVATVPTDYKERSDALHRFSMVFSSATMGATNSPIARKNSYLGSNGFIGYPLSDTTPPEASPRGKQRKHAPAR